MKTQSAAARLHLRDPRESRQGDGLHLVPREAGWLPPELAERHWVARHEQLLVAEDRRNGEVLAMLGANRVRALECDCLLAEIGILTGQLPDRHVLRRLLATALLQAAREGSVPDVLALGCERVDVWHAARTLAARFGVRLYPCEDGKLVTLAAAKLARRIARNAFARFRFDTARSVLRGPAWEPHGISPTAEDAGLRITGLQPGEQYLALLDLRAISPTTILDLARRIRRRG